MLSIVYLALFVAAPLGATASSESSSGESCHVDTSQGDVANLLQYPVHIHNRSGTDLDPQVDEEGLGDGSSPLQMFEELEANGANEALEENASDPGKKLTEEEIEKLKAKAYKEIREELLENIVAGVSAIPERAKGRLDDLMWQIEGPSDTAKTGEQACEGHSFDQKSCMDIGCCVWKGGTCWSAVGGKPCKQADEKEDDPDTHKKDDKAKADEKQDKGKA